MQVHKPIKPHRDDRTFVCECGAVIGKKNNSVLCFGAGVYCRNCHREVTKGYLRYGLVSLHTHLQTQYCNVSKKRAAEMLFERWFNFVVKKFGYLASQEVDSLYERFLQKHESDDLGRFSPPYKGRKSYYWHNVRSEPVAIFSTGRTEYREHVGTKTFNRITKEIERIERELDKSRNNGAKKSSSKGVKRGTGR